MKLKIIYLKSNQLSHRTLKLNPLFNSVCVCVCVHLMMIQWYTFGLIIYMANQLKDQKEESKDNQDRTDKKDT